MDQQSEVPSLEMRKGRFADTITYSPVTVSLRETTGIIFLGLLAIFLFIELRRTKKRYDELLARVQ